MRYLPFLYSDLYWGVQLRGHHHPLEALAPSFFCSEAGHPACLCVSMSKNAFELVGVDALYDNISSLNFLFNYYPNLKSIFIVFLFHAAKVRRKMITMK